MAILAVQHIRRMRGGAQGQLMLGADGHPYVVKFQNNPQHMRVLQISNPWEPIGRRKQGDARGEHQPAGHPNDKAYRAHDDQPPHHVLANEPIRELRRSARGVPVNQGHRGVLGFRVRRPGMTEMGRQNGLNCTTTRRS